MSLCQSIDTLAMSYLDDELVGAEKRELELHIFECTSCKQHVESERAELQLVRKALVPPPAPDVVKARIARMLDDEDREIARSGRRRSLSFLGRWFLPGAATVAATAAVILALVAIQPSEPSRSAMMTKEVVRQQGRTMPLEVQGVRTRPWLRENFAPIEPPQFRAPQYDIELQGARLTAVAGHNAAQLRYLVINGNNRFTLTAVVIDELRPDDLAGGTALKFGDRTLYVHDANGMPAITFVDEQHMGYAFASERLTSQELLELVVSSDLIGRASQGR